MADEFVSKKELEAILANFLKMINAKKNVSDAGGGDVVGPGAATDEAVARFDGVTGKLIQNSAFIVNDAGIITAGGWQGSDINNQYITSTVRARAYLSGDQLNIANATWTTVELNTENYDTGNDFDTANHYFTAPVSGYYDIKGGLRWLNTIADKVYGCGIWIDATDYTQNIMHVSIADGIFVLNLADTLYVAAGEKIYLKCIHFDGTANPDIDAGSYTYMSVHLLST